MHSQRHQSDWTLRVHCPAQTLEGWASADWASAQLWTLHSFLWLQADVEKPLLIVIHSTSWLPALLSLSLFLRHEKQNCQNVPDALHRQKALLWLSLFFCGVVSGKQHCFLAAYYARSEMSGAKGNANFLVVASLLW